MLCAVCRSAALPLPGRKGQPASLRSAVSLTGEQLLSHTPARQTRFLQKQAMIKNNFKPILIHRMVAVVPQGNKRGIEDEYRFIINKLRRYSASSIVDLVLPMMWHEPEKGIDRLRAIPWLALLLVKWALQDKMVGLRVGSKMSQRDLDNLRQQLWDLQGQKAVDRADRNVWLMLRSNLHVQVEFQRNENWSYVRWPALYARLNPNGINRRQFRAAMGMEPEVFIDLANCMYSAVINREMPIGPDYLAPMRPQYGEAVDALYRLFVRDLSQLRDELRSDVAQKIRGKQELYEFPYLKRFPLLRMRDGNIHCWHPLVFARGLEEAVHLRLSEQGADYVEPFSRVFEEYVTELTVEACPKSLVESSYKAIVGGESSAVEVIVQEDGCNIFIEAKMSLFADDVLLQDDETAAFNKTKRVRDAIKQGWKVGAKIREPSSKLGESYSVDQDFLVVVTSRDLVIGGGDSLKRLFASNKMAYPDADAELRLPLSNVFIMSIDNFENTIGCVGAGEVSFSTLLKEAAIANQDGATGRMFFSDFLHKYTKKWSQPRLLREALEASERRTEEVLGKP